MRQDPELPEPGQLRDDVDVKRSAKYVQPVRLGKIFKGKDGQGNLVAVYSLHFSIIAIRKQAFYDDQYNGLTKNCNLICEKKGLQHSEVGEWPNLVQERFVPPW